MESVPSSATLGGYPDSVDSSPRSRGGESWDEPYPSASAGSSRLRLMCSYGGRIVPRPTDKSLCYLGGETRIVVVDRHASLADLHSKLSRTLLAGRPFSLKYQLPNEDLDSLISVSTDEDLDNMIDEYDRIVASGSTGSGSGSTGGGSARTSRIRLFLFPSKPESSSSIGSLLDDSTKSETWFVDALNSAIGTIDGLPRGISADSTSVNCLLGLEDDSSTHSRPAAAAVVAGGPGDQKLSRPDVHSVPDSPLLDKSSSFGSTSSAPSLSNLPPIRVRPDDRPPDHRMQGNIEDHFAHMTLPGSAAQPEVVQPAQVPFQPHHPMGIPAPNTTSVATSAFSPSENPNRVVSDDERSDHSVGAHRPQQTKPAEAPPSDPPSRPIYYQERVSNEPVKRDVPVTADGTYRMPVPVSETAAYVYPPIPQSQPPPQSQPQQPLHHLPPQQNQQVTHQPFIPTNPQYIHHAPSGTFVPVPSYYPVQQPPQQAHFDPQMQMYYLPVRQNPAPYNLAAVTPSLVDPNSGKPAVAVTQVPVKQEVPPTSLYRTAGAPAATPAPATAYPGMGYHLMQTHQQVQHHPSQSPAAVANYGYEFADPSRGPIYYSQATTTSPPAMAHQYQAVTAVTAPLTEPHGELKQTKQS
ncbi:hypothetical protein LUZ61_004569 [Rhynchospora tenuis]|uniref:PB1 domain-containing protein n=1 Tax=Rhynchospora tenuis TaxID=198213 RepID=A0AAD5ZN02_9POAL|nr:hypothetical protein LUZ61_004569 [Rhynchospora tenuis]